MGKIKKEKIFIGALIFIGLLCFVWHERSIISYILFGLFVIAYVVVYIAKKQTNRLWVQKLFVRQHGPRSQVKEMSKKELYLSAKQYLVYTIPFIFLFILSSIYCGNCAHYPTVAQGVMFGSMLLGMTFICAGGYCFVRAIFKK